MSADFRLHNILEVIAHRAMKWQYDNSVCEIIDFFCRGTLYIARPMPWCGFCFNVSRSCTASNFFHHLVVPSFYFFCSKRYSSIPTGSPEQQHRIQYFVLSRKWYKIGLQLPWNVNRNLYAIYGMVPFPMTFKMVQDRVIVTTADW